MGNNTVVPYLIKSAKAWMKRMKKSKPGFDEFFSYTYALAKAQRTEVPKILAEFLAEAETTNLFSFLYHNFDLHFWIERSLAKRKKNAG